MLKSERREAKQRKQKHGMRLSGRSVKTVLARQSTGSIGLAAKRKRGRRRTGREEGFS